MTYKELAEEYFNSAAELKEKIEIMLFFNVEVILMVDVIHII